MGYTFLGNSRPPGGVDGDYQQADAAGGHLEPLQKHVELKLLKLHGALRETEHQPRI